MTDEYYLCMPTNFRRRRDLLQQVYDKQVVLEDIFIRSLTMYGRIRVNNCAYDKKVLVKYTIDEWKSCSFVKAHHGIFYSDNNTNLFQFQLTILDDLLKMLPRENSRLPIRLSFAICYIVHGQEFWDNNYSQDYILEVRENTQKQSIGKSILFDDVLRTQIPNDYYAVSNGNNQQNNICGLKNLGSTCYMNAVLQSLFFTTSLTRYFLSNENSSNEIIANEYLNLIYLLSCKKYSVITPIPFKQVIGHINNFYFEYKQQDAHEFLLFLLDYLDEDLKKLNRHEQQSSTRIDNCSVIVDLFHGTYRTTITCLECMYASTSFEPFMCLTLSIPLMNSCTLEDCLQHLNQEEDLVDDTKWFCPKCQNLTNGRRRLEIYKLPKVLIIQFKRFQLNHNMNWIKNDTIVLYPEDNFSLEQSCCSSSSSPQQSNYILYSVINHDGSIDSGHFTTFCRDLMNNKQTWFECDDEQIRYLNSDKLNPNSKAYILFYTMK